MVNTNIQIEKLAYVPPTKLHDAVALTVSGGATPSVTSAAKDIAGVAYVTISALNGKSTSLDVLVYASYDNVTYDTLPYASMNIGANVNKTIALNPGPAYIKVTITNSDAVNASTVTVGVNLTYI